jgi:hypothetical protein
MSYYEKYIKQYQKTPKGKYGVQRANAKRRGISWEFTFETWWKLWQESGKWDLRGTESHQYCMARVHDEGPYSPDNVLIRTMASNSRDCILHNMHFK